MNKHVSNSISVLFIILVSATFAFAAPSKGIKRLGYAIQMGAFSNVSNAERFAKKLQKKGIEAFYFRKDSGVYAVRYGDFPSKEKARISASRLIDAGLIDSFYIAPPNEIVFSATKAPATPATKTATPVRNGKTDSKDKTPDTDVTPGKTAKSDRDMGFIAARTAERFVGIPYRWGGDTVVDGLDCSGFVRAVYNLCGVNIPRTSREQYKTGESVSKSELKDGDLVFFGSSASKINHVGIYVGNDKFVHAPRRGEDIKVAGIHENYFEKRFVGARRYFQ